MGNQNSAQASDISEHKQNRRVGKVLAWVAAIGVPSAVILAAQQTIYQNNIRNLKDIALIIRDHMNRFLTEDVKSQNQLQEQLQAALQAAKQWQQQLQAAETKILHLENENKELGLLRQRLQAAETKIDDLQSFTKLERESKGVLDSKLVISLEQKNKIKGELIEKQNETISDLTTQNRTLQNQLDESSTRGDIRFFQNAIPRLKTNRDSLKSKYNDLEKQNQEWTQTVTNLEETIQAKETLNKTYMDRLLNRYTIDKYNDSQRNLIQLIVFNNMNELDPLQKQKISQYLSDSGILHDVKTSTNRDTLEVFTVEKMKELNDKQARRITLTDTENKLHAQTTEYTFQALASGFFEDYDEEHDEEHDEEEEEDDEEKAEKGRFRRFYTTVFPENSDLGPMVGSNNDPLAPESDDDFSDNGSDDDSDPISHFDE